MVLLRLRFMAVELPMPGGASANARSVGGFKTSRLGARLWWLEADRHLCSLLEGRLTACGWRLTLFHKSAALLAALQHDQPDLLILDRLVLGTDGMMLLQSLRHQHYEFLVLILSAMGAPEDRIQGFAHGANDYLTKPFRSAELIWRLERLLQRVPPSLIQRLPVRGCFP
jgi:DNA-binding response OmpR family regulator